MNKVIHFTSHAGGTIPMLDGDAVALLRRAGHTGSVPGALQGHSLADAISALERSLSIEQSAVAEGNDGGPRDPGLVDHSDPEEPEEAVTMGQRAWPLLKLMQRAQSESAPVLWDYA